MKIKKILIWSSAGIGNSILIIPMLKRLKKEIPDSDIDLITNSRAIKEIFTNSPDFDNIILIDRELKNLLFTNPIKFSKNMLKILFLKKYDIYFSMFPDNNSILNLLIKAKMKIYHDYKKEGKNISIENIHDIEQNLNLLKPLGINVKDSEKERLELWLGKEDKQFAKRFFDENKLNNKMIIGMHPGSTGSSNSMLSKRWPAENFSKLTGLLVRKHNAKVLVFLGPEEEDLEQYFTKNKNVQIIKGFPINKVISLISKCNYFVSNDSGLMHIATALDVPVLAMFGSTAPVRTRPMGRHVLIQTKVKCAPCAHTIENLGKEFKCIHNSPICMKSISVNTALKGFDQLIKKFLGKLSTKTKTSSTITAEAKY